MDLKTTLQLELGDKTFAELENYATVRVLPLHVALQRVVVFGLAAINVKLIDDDNNAPEQLELNFGDQDE